MSVGRKRFLALLAAAAMVFAAFGVRELLDGGTADQPASRPNVLCSAELAAICADLDEQGLIHAHVEQGDLVAELSAPEAPEVARQAGYDAWLATSTDAAIVRDAAVRAQREAPITEPGPVLGRSPLLLAAWKDRADVLARRCGAPVDWQCLGDVGGASWAELGGDGAWGTVKPGHADPALHGLGLLEIGQAATSYYDRVGLSRDNYEADGFLDWFGRLERAVRPTSSGTPLEAMLLTGAAAYDVVGTTEAEAVRALRTASPERRDHVALIYPARVATADLVLAPIRGAPNHERAAEIVAGDAGRAALARAGWRVPGQDRAPGVPTSPALPVATNLPDPGSLEALLATWQEVTS